jgi:hypothetical protein
LPPQVTGADDLPVVALPRAALLSLPHADNITAAAARTLNAAPNRLSFNSFPSTGTAEMIAAGAVFLAAVRHSNKIAFDNACPAITGHRRIHHFGHPGLRCGHRPSPWHLTLTSVGKSLN